MSQDQCYVLLKTFGPIPSKDISVAFGQAQGTVQSALKRLKRRGDARYIPVRGKCGRYGVWDAL